MANRMAPEALYVQLGRLAETIPNLKLTGTYLPDTLRWLARVSALLSELGDIGEQAAFKVAWDRATDNRNDPFVRDECAERMATVLYRALAKAELSAPVSAQGAFISAGNEFDAFVGVAKVLSSATKNVLIVDPYMDAKTLTDFASSAPEGVSVRLLADHAFHKPTLIPAVQRWVKQHNTRPLEARFTTDRTLHDRLIVVDGNIAFTLSQSLNALASRSPATIVRVDDPDIAALKIATYENFWNAATVIR